MTSKIVEQRSQIWQKYDEACLQQKELAQYSGQFGTSAELPEIALLSGGTPPDELAASIWQLKQEKEKISQAEARIQKYQDEIAETKKQFFIVMGVAFLVVILGLFMLFKR